MKDGWNRREVANAIEECARSIKGMSNITFALAESQTQTEPEELLCVALSLRDDFERLAEIARKAGGMESA